MPFHTGRFALAKPLLWLFLYQSKFGNTTVEEITDASCSAGSTDCIVTCTNCPSTIDCPTTSSCDSCIINCSAENACKTRTIYGHSCSNVIVNCNATSSEQKMAESAIIYAPDSFGNLTLNSDIGHKCFKSVTVYSSTNTGSIEINCNDDPDNGEECKQMTVDASLATNLKFQCLDGARCESSVITCPSNEYMQDGDWGTPCLINCNNTGSATDACISMSVSTADGLNGDMTWLCDDTNSASCTSSILYCTEGNTGSCAWDYISNDWDCIGDCIPTMAPTYLPSINPTIIPTYNPSIMPSIIPSKNPTELPTTASSNTNTIQSSSSSTSTTATTPHTGDNSASSSSTTITTTTTGDNTNNNENTMSTTTDDNGNNDASTSSSSLFGNEEVLIYVIIAVVIGVICLVSCISLMLCLYFQSKHSNKKISEMSKKIEILSQSQSPVGFQSVNGDNHSFKNLPTSMLNTNNNILHTNQKSPLNTYNIGDSPHNGGNDDGDGYGDGPGGAMPPPPSNLSSLPNEGQNDNVNNNNDDAANEGHNINNITGFGQKLDLEENDNDDNNDDDDDALAYAAPANDNVNDFVNIKVISQVASKPPPSRPPPPPQQHKFKPPLPSRESINKKKLSAKMAIASESYDSMNNNNNNENGQSGFGLNLMNVNAGMDALEDDLIEEMGNDVKTIGGPDDNDDADYHE